MVSMALLSLPVIAPVVAKALHISPALVGLYVATTYAGAMTASLLGGASVKRWGAIRVSQWGLLSCAAGLVLCALPLVPVMFFGAILIGLGYGPITPASSHILARTTAPHQMSLVFSIKQTGVPLGSMLAGVMVPPLMLLLDWQWSLITVAGFCLLCAALAQPLRRELDADRQPHHPFDLNSLLAPVRLVRAHRALVTMAACSFLFSMVQMSTTTYLVTYLYQDLGYGLVAAGLALSVAQVGGVAGRIVWGYVADRWLGPSRMLMLLATLMVAGAWGTACLTDQTPRWLVWMCLALFGACAIGWNGVYLAEVARKAPAGMASLATGGTLAFTFLGVVLGPPIFGALSTVFGTYRAGFFSLMVVATISGLLLLQQYRTKVHNA
ncbi:MAG: MFS transporter [Burkholderiaceae bacterium]|nr:MFS transporter [Burkholderiaceae bacterium]